MHAPRPFPSVPSLLVLAALLAAAPLAAQGSCPRRQANHVTAGWQVGPTVDCGGITLSSGGGTYTSTVRGCPLSAVFVPPHDIEGSSAQETQVQVIGNAPIELFTYECHSDWFLFIKVGSACVAQGHQTIGQVPQLRTVPCVPTTSVPTTRAVPAVLQD